MPAQGNRRNPINTTPKDKAHDPTHTSNTVQHETPIAHAVRKEAVCAAANTARVDRASSDCPVAAYIEQHACQPREPPASIALNWAHHCALGIGHLGEQLPRRAATSAEAYKWESDILIHLPQLRT